MKKSYLVTIIVIFVLCCLTYFYHKIQNLASSSIVSSDLLQPSISKEKFLFDEKGGLKSTREFDITEIEKQNIFEKLLDVKYICAEFKCDYELSNSSYKILLIKKFLAFDVKYDGIFKIKSTNNKVTFLFNGYISLPSLSNNFKEPVNIKGIVSFDFSENRYPKVIVRKIDLKSPYFAKIKSHPFRQGFEYAAFTMEENIFNKFKENYK